MGLVHWIVLICPVFLAIFTQSNPQPPLIVSLITNKYRSTSFKYEFHFHTQLFFLEINDAEIKLNLLADLGYPVYNLNGIGKGW